MPRKPKALTEKQIKQIREAASYGKVADTLGISQERAKAIKVAPTLEQAMKIAAPEEGKPKPGKAIKREEEKIIGVLTEASMKPEAAKPQSSPTPVPPIVLQPQPGGTPETLTVPQVQPGVTPNTSAVVTPAVPEHKPGVTPEISIVPQPQPGVTPPTVQPQPRVLIPEEIVGKGILIGVVLSLATLTYYQIASTMENNLVLGDFLDQCVQDTFEVRGHRLGLIDFKKGA